MKYHWRRCVIFGLSAVVAVCSAVGAKNLFSAASAAETAVLAETDTKEIVKGIYEAASHSGYDIEASDGRTLARVQIGYGSAESLNAFDTFEETKASKTIGKKIYMLSGSGTGDACWSSDGNESIVMTLEIREDTYLGISHEAFEYNGFYSWSVVSVSVYGADGYFGAVSSHTLGSKEGEEKRTVAADSMLSDAGNVKAGDKVVVRVFGNEYGAKMSINPAFTFRESTEEVFGETSVSSSDILGGIASNPTHTLPVFDGRRKKVADIGAFYGKAGETDTPFDIYAENKCSVSAEKGKYAIGLSGWYSDDKASSYYKISVSEDCDLRLKNNAFTHGGYYNWTSIAVTRGKENGAKMRIFSSSPVSSLSEGGGKTSYKEGEFYDYSFSVNAGDTVYFEVVGNEYGSNIEFDPGFVFSEQKPAEYEYVSAGSMVYNTKQTQGGTVENSSLTSYRVMTGTIERPVSFNSFTEGAVSYIPSNSSSPKSSLSATKMLVDNNYSVIVAVDILSDCRFRFVHDAVARGTWADNYTKVQIFKDGGEGAELLKETTVTTFAVAANYYCPDTYDAAAGETYYFLYRTSNTYYAEFKLSVGYEAGTLKDLPESEEKTVENFFAENPSSGELYEVAFSECAAGGESVLLACSGGACISESGVRAGKDFIVVPTGYELEVTFLAKGNIRLSLSGAEGAKKILLAGGIEGATVEHLKKGDTLTLVYGETERTDWNLSLKAERGKYTEGARKTGQTQETYDLFDMMIQQATTSEEFNHRALSSFRLSSGKLYGDSASLVCYNWGEGKVTHPEATQYTGVQTLWYDFAPYYSKGTKILADNGYDTIIEVTVKEDSLVTLAHNDMPKEQWALNTYVKALAQDTDGTTVLLYDKVVTKTFKSDYFAAAVNLKAGQSFLLVYYTPSTNYGAVDLLPSFTIDTEGYDVEKVLDFETARVVKEYKEGLAEELQTLTDSLREDDYSGTSWLDIQNYLSSGKNKILEASDKESADRIYAEYETLILSVKTAAESQAELNEFKEAKIAELKAFYDSLNRKDYSEGNWNKLSQIYENGIATIQGQINETKVENAYLSVKTAMESVERDGGSGCGSVIIPVNLGFIVLVMLGFTGYILKKERE